MPDREQVPGGIRRCRLRPGLLLLLFHRQRGGGWQVLLRLCDLQRAVGAQRRSRRGGGTKAIQGETVQGLFERFRARLGVAFGVHGLRIWQQRCGGLLLPGSRREAVLRPHLFAIAGWYFIQLLFHSLSH